MNIHYMDHAVNFIKVFYYNKYFFNIKEQCKESHVPLHGEAVNYKLIVLDKATRLFKQPNFIILCSDFEDTIANSKVKCNRIHKIVK